jgi:hemerythrin
MEKVIWLDQYNTGIEEIDGQHQQIASYLNRLCDAKKSGDDTALDEVIEGIIDYTWSHFAFEEAMMEQAGYSFASAHKNVHQMFINRVEKFQSRFAAGEDIAEEFYSLLKRWLVNHIQRDDAAYVRPIKSYLQSQAPALPEKKEADAPQGWLARLAKKFFTA